MQWMRPKRCFWLVLPYGVLLLVGKGVGMWVDGVGGRGREEKMRLIEGVVVIDDDGCCGA